MPAPKEWISTRRLIAPPPFPIRPTGAFALKVTKLRGQRYLLLGIQLLGPAEGGAVEEGFYRHQVGPRKSGQRRVCTSGLLWSRKVRAQSWKSRSSHADVRSAREPREEAAKAKGDRRVRPPPTPQSQCQNPLIGIGNYYIVRSPNNVAKLWSGEEAGRRKWLRQGRSPDIVSAHRRRPGRRSIWRNWICSSRRFSSPRKTRST